MAEKALALLSSGLDSAMALAMALKKGTEVVSCLTFDYGQRAAGPEQVHAAQIARHFNIKHEVLRLAWFDTFQKQGLLAQASPLPHPEMQELDRASFTEKSAQAVWVPNRNGVFLEVAASLAEDRGVKQILVGFNAEEAVTFPDNSVEYLHAINRALYFSTGNRVEVTSPTATLTKDRIVAKAKELGFPFELLWSCYEDRPTMCGRCESCMRLKRALNKNEVGLASLFDDPSI